MALLGKTDWYSAEKKIILTIALAILIASVSVLRECSLVCLFAPFCI